MIQLQPADLSTPWGRFFQILCVSQIVRTLQKKITGIKIDTTDNFNNFCRKTDMLYHQKKQKQIHSFTSNIFSIILTSINCQIFKNIGDIPSSAEGFLVKYENVELIFLHVVKKVVLHISKVLILGCLPKTDPQSYQKWLNEWIEKCKFCLIQEKSSAIRIFPL